MVSSAFIVFHYHTQLGLMEKRLTIDPGEDHALGEGDDHEGEGRTVPVHHL